MANWRDEEVDVDKLKLDLQNPRLPKYVKDFQDENNIRDYLLEKEGISRIARSITNNGYHHSAVSITYQDENGDYVVLDGNRRLAACQLLKNPALAADAKKRKEFEILSKELPKQALKNIKIAVAPSRKDAEKEIWDIHVTPSSKPWEVLQKLRMYRNLIETGDYDIPEAAQEYGMSENKFKSELSKLFLYERLLENADETGQEELNNSGFNKIQRVLMSKNGQQLLGFEIDNKGKVGIGDVGTFDKNIAKLAPYIIEPNRVNAQATQEDLVDTVYSQIDPVSFPPKKSGKKTGAANGKTKKKTSTGSTSKTDWVMDSEYRQYSGADRVKNILEELKKNKPQRGQNLNIVAIALRVVIELALYHVLMQKGHIQKMINAEKARVKLENTKRVKAGKPLLSATPKDWVPTLAQMMDYMLVEANRVITDPQERKSLARIRASKKAYIGDLNGFIHNVAFKPTESDTRDIWETFGRQVFDTIKKI